MPLPALSQLEVPGDALTNLAKTGGLVRSKDNAALDALAKYLPAEVHGVPVEYDVTYDAGGPAVRGYKYTDLLTSVLWVTPCNVGLSVALLKQAMSRPITPQGARVFAAIANQGADKYASFRACDAHDKLVIMPGSNVLQKRVIDIGKLDDAVARGAWIKPHPVTNALDLRRLHDRYKDRVLPHATKLYPALRAAKQLWGTAYSESCIASVLFGTPYRLLERTGEDWPASFKEIVMALDLANPLADRTAALLHLLSYPEYGFVSIYHANPERCLQQFFDHCSEYRHA